MILRGLLNDDDRGPIFLSLGFQQSVCGHEFLLGYLSGEIKSWTSTPIEYDDSGRPTLIRLEPTDDESRHPIFRLSREQASRA